LIQRILLKNKLGETLEFIDPVDVIYATKLSEINQCLDTIEDYRSTGFYIAGYLSYESGWAFLDKANISIANTMPLCVFGVFHSPKKFKEFPKVKAVLPTNVMFSPNISNRFYDRVINQIQEEIKKGNTYQVNFTFQLELEEITSHLIERAIDLEPWPYSALIELDGFTIFSSSPELFFQKTKELILCKPMKGTMRRVSNASQDKTIKIKLENSSKDRAENIMITDMIRNDLGKICKPSSIKEVDLCRVAPYPTVWQMTSTVTGKSEASAVDIFRSLFPSASITGAPKLSTMNIIHELEQSPREIYTGTIGYIDPNGDAQFNVAIRTLVINHHSQKLSYGVGSGITIDSESTLEYQECLDKALALDLLLT
jgi:para-aminobenzoate synthetase/4-amino-4-deoxychorismate lyase